MFLNKILIIRPDIKKITPGLQTLEDHGLYEFGRGFITAGNTDYDPVAPSHALLFKDSGRIYIKKIVPAVCKRDKMQPRHTYPAGHLPFYRRKPGSDRIGNIWLVNKPNHRILLCASTQNLIDYNKKSVK